MPIVRSTRNRRGEALTVLGSGRRWGRYGMPSGRRYGHIAWRRRESRGGSKRVERDDGAGERLGHRAGPKFTGPHFYACAVPVHAKGARFQGTAVWEGEGCTFSENGCACHEAGRFYKSMLEMQLCETMINN